jgi:uncharacterized protein (DUF362 family)
LSRIKYKKYIFVKEKQSWKLFNGDQVSIVLKGGFPRYCNRYIPGTSPPGEKRTTGAMDSPGLVEVNLSNHRLHSSYYLNRKYYEADFLISVPTLKNHSSAAVTGGIKNVGIGAPPSNIYGDSLKEPLRLNAISHYTTDLHACIHDFYLCRLVDFVITDGLQGFQNRPGHMDAESLTADQMNMRLILAGTDAIAVDTIASLLVGWDPESAAHLTYLNASSAGNIDTSCITVRGERVMDVNNDGAVDIIDALLIAQHYVGLLPEFY